MRNGSRPASPQTVVLILSSVDDGQLLSDIQVAVRGDQADKRLALEALQRLIDPAAVKLTPADRDSRDEMLSSRERDVLELLAYGYSNRQIAERLCITTHTVKAHVEHILTKLGVSGRTQAAIRAIELGYKPADAAR